ncbi:hypothetical protein A6P53_10415 [Enterococcus hirae]|nr:hypothetical protein A6P53_10415 [Enterococcus hirae]
MIWFAALTNGKNGKLVSDWKEFKHGTNSLFLNIDKTQVQVGDTLQLVLHANSGKGIITLIAGQ